MDTLKRILTVMVIVFVVIVAGGGLYLASMGGMNHGTVDANNTVSSHIQAGDTKNIDNAKNTGEKEDASSNSETSQGKDNNGQINKEGPASPIIVQIPAPTQTTDPSVHVNQLREKLKSINESNSSIASNSSTHGAIQSDGSSTAAGQGNMNQLHQDFYKLGKDIAAMENTLEDLSKELQQGTVQKTEPGYYQYSLPNNVPANQGQNQQGVNQQHPNPQQVDPQHTAPQQGAHGSTGINIFNADTLKLIFTMVLVVSIIFGIFSVVGFMGSLFKGNPAK